MNKTTIKGKANEIVGAVREHAGRATGNDSLEANGVAQESKGQTQATVGNLREEASHLKDRVKKTVKR